MNDFSIKSGEVFLEVRGLLLDFTLRQVLGWVGVFWLLEFESAEGFFRLEMFGRWELERGGPTTGIGFCTAANYF